MAGCWDTRWRTWYVVVLLCAGLWLIAHLMWHRTAISTTEAQTLNLQTQIENEPSSSGIGTKDLTTSVSKRRQAQNAQPIRSSLRVPLDL